MLAVYFAVFFSNDCPHCQLIGFSFSVTETHQLAEANEEKNARMKEALGIKDDYKSGSSFDQELKEAQRKSEQLAWEAVQREIEKQKERVEMRRWE